MFAMGWAATRWMKGSEQAFGLNWLKVMSAAPLALLPPAGDRAAAKLAALTVDSDICATTEAPLATPLLSPRDEDTDFAPLVAGLSSLLTRRLASAEMSVLPPWRRSCFHKKEDFDMHLNDYVAHIQWFFECSSPCLVLAMIYLDRAVSGGAKLPLSAETGHRLFLTCLVAAVKFHDDDWTPYPNAFYANVGQVSVEDMNAMEKQFCKSIDWHFNVGPDEYSQYRDLIEAAAPTASAA